MEDVWVYLLAFVGAVVVAVLAAFLGRALYVQQVRRSLVRLLSSREEITAAAKGMDRVIEHLLSDEDDVLATFAADAGSDERRAVDDIASRMTIAADHLRQVALPKSLWPVADDMERAARALAAQAGGVGEADSPDGALDALAAIDLSEIREQMALVNEHLEPQLEAFRVDDPAVYGGGLYI